MSFRILDQTPVYLLNNGLPAAGGFLRFYQSGTTDPKDVFGDPGLSVNNGPEIELNASGRSPVEIWGDGNYRVRLYDENDILQSEADDVQAQGGSGQTIPTLDSGKYLTNDGANLLWALIRQVPDPTGQSGKVLQSDGTIAQWVAQAVVSANATVTFPSATSVKISDGTTARLIQWGTDSIPASNAPSAQKAVSFGALPFTATPFVVPFPYAQANVAPAVLEMLATPTGSGFTVVADLAEGNPAQANIISPIPFGWFAAGPVAP